MTPATAVLAALPPVFAILVEIFNPVSEPSIRRSVERDLEAHGKDADFAHLVDDATGIASGAVEVSGLAPTLVAAVTSGFGVLYELPKPWLVFTYVLVFATIVLVTLRFLAGQTYLQIDSQRPSQDILGWKFTLPWPASSGVRLLIFVANFLLIGLVAIVYLSGASEAAALPGSSSPSAD